MVTSAVPKTTSSDFSNHGSSYCGLCAALDLDYGLLWVMLLILRSIMYMNSLSILS